MNPTKFNTSARFDGKSLRMTLPMALANRRFEAYYGDGKIIVAISHTDKAPKCQQVGDKEHPSAQINFGRKWVEGCPLFKTRTEVNWDGRQFILDVSQATTVTALTPVIGNSNRIASKSDTAQASITFLNKYTAENGYEFEIRGGKLSLVRTERIE